MSDAEDDVDDTEHESSDQRTDGTEHESSNQRTDGTEHESPRRQASRTPYDPDDDEFEVSEQQAQKFDVESVENLIEIEDGDHLEEVVEAHDLLFVNCYAVWCEHCQSMQPVVEEVATTQDVVFANVNVDENRGIAGRLVDDELPRIVLFVDGQQVARMTGEHDEEMFERVLEEVDDLREQL